jgi:hypothetical protein
MMPFHCAHITTSFEYFLLGIYFIYISNAISKVPHTLPQPPTPTSWSWRSPVLRQIKFARPMGLSFNWWPTRPCSDIYASRDTSSRVLVSSYCCSTYRVADPFSSLGTFYSSSIGGPVFHPVADCEHPLLCLPGTRIASQETAISGIFQQNLAGICNGVCIWRLIMGWIWQHFGKTFTLIGWNNEAVYAWDLSLLLTLHWWGTLCCSNGIGLIKL